MRWHSLNAKGECKMYNKEEKVVVNPKNYLKQKVLEELEKRFAFIERLDIICNNMLETLVSQDETEATVRSIESLVEMYVESEFGEGINPCDKCPETDHCTDCSFAWLRERLR